MRRRSFIKALGFSGVVSLFHGGFSPCAGGASAADCPPAGLKGPFGVAVAPSGHVLATDSPGYCVVEHDPGLNPISCFGGPGSAPGKMNYPRGAAVDQDGVIYVVDANNCRVQVFNDNGTLRGVIGSIGSIGGSFATPQGIFIDSEGRVLVADTRNHRVQIFENFRLIAVLGEFGYEENQFCLPTACAAGSDGTIFVLDSKSKYGLVKIFDKDMKFKGSFAPNGDGPGELNDPQGMTIDDQGNLWVADTRNHRIQEFGSTGAFMSVWGGKEAGADRFLNPTGVARRGDRVYVADYGNKRIAMLRVSAG